MNLQIQLFSLACVRRSRSTFFWETMLLLLLLLAGTGVNSTTENMNYQRVILPADYLYEVIVVYARSSIECAAMCRHKHNYNVCTSYKFDKTALSCSCGKADPFRIGMSGQGDPTHILSSCTLPGMYVLSLSRILDGRFYVQANLDFRAQRLINLETPVLV